MLADIGFDDPVVSAVRQHHERLDGSGYPEGLTRGDIVAEARVIAVADVLEAMTSRRPHRGALEMRDAFAQIKTARGRLFDEDAVDACARALARGIQVRPAPGSARRGAHLLWCSSVDVCSICSLLSPPDSKQGICRCLTALGVRGG